MIYNFIKSLFGSRKSGLVESISFRGHLKVSQIRGGEVIATREGKNLVVTVGVAWFMGALSGDVVDPTLVKYVGMGTGAVAPIPANTALGNQVCSRVEGTASRTTTTLTNDTFYVDATVPADNTYAITEVGIFSAASAGTMLARKTFAALNLVSGDSLRAEWSIVGSAT
jgi:hypothetical protein